MRWLGARLTALALLGLVAAGSGAAALAQAAGADAAPGIVVPGIVVPGIVVPGIVVPGIVVPPAAPPSPAEAAEAEAAARAAREAVMDQPPPAQAPVPGAPPAAAPATGAPPALPAAEAQRLADILRDETRRNDLLATLDSLARVAGPAQPESLLPLVPQSLGAQLLLAVSTGLGNIAEAVIVTFRSASDLPALMEAGQRFVFDPAVRGRAFDVLWKVIVVLACGIAVERLLMMALRPARRRIVEAGAVADSYAARVRLSLTRLVLDLLPVIAFAVVSYATITAIERWPSQRVLLLVVNNAYLAARLARALGRVVFAPDAPKLRLIMLADETAAYCQVWLQRFTVWIVTGYAAAEATLIFGLGAAAQKSILNILSFVVMAFLVLIVMQNRAAVAAAIRAPEDARGVWPVVRNRLGDIWHIIAAVYLVAGWAVSFLEISGGYAQLMRFTAATLIVLGAAKLAELGTDRVLNRLFRVENELAGQYPGLEDRVNRYTPVLRKLLHGMIWAVALIVLLQAWGFGSFDWFQSGRLGARVIAAALSVLFTIAVALLIWEMTNAAINRHLERVSRDAEVARTARVRTLLPMLRTALMITMLVIVGLIILYEIGVNIAPLLAGAGVIGIAVGFGSQTLVRDVITGIFLLAEDAIAVGDVVNVGGQGGVVEALSIRSIRLRSVDGTVHIVPFSAVTTVSNMTKDFAFAVFDIGVAYGEDTDKVVEVLRALGAEMRAEPRWRNVIREELEVLGVDRFLDSAVIIRVRFRTNPGSQWAVSREFNRRYKRRFDEVGIEIPFPYRKVVVQQPPGEAPLSAEAREAAAIAGAS